MVLSGRGLSGAVTASEVSSPFTRLHRYENPEEFWTLSDSKRTNGCVIFFSSTPPPSISE